MCMNLQTQTAVMVIIGRMFMGQGEVRFFFPSVSKVQSAYTHTLFSHFPLVPALVTCY